MPTKKPRKGRPKSTAKGEAILNAARELMLEEGFANVSMDRVAERAGVGKPTIYNRYASKEELFTAVLGERQRQLVSQLGSPGTDDAPPQQVLLAFAERFQKVILDARARRWDRLVISEAMRHPKLAQALFKAGPARVHAMLAKYIKQQTKRGNMAAPDADAAAEQLLGLLLGLEMVRGQMASQPRRTAKDLRKRAESAIATFMAAYGNEEAS